VRLHKCTLFEQHLLELQIWRLWLGVVAIESSVICILNSRSMVWSGSALCTCRGHCTRMFCVPTKTAPFSTGEKRCALECCLPSRPGDKAAL